MTIDTQRRARRISSSLSMAVLLCGAASVAVAAPTESDPKARRHHARPHAAHGAGSEVRQLKEQVRQLTDQLQQLQSNMQAVQSWRETQTAAQAQTEQQLAATREQAAQATARADRAEAQVQGQIQTIPTEVTAAVEAAKPKTDKLYYKGIGITLGGFLAAEGIYRSRAETADISSSFSSIPFNNNVAGHTSEARGTARQSRLSILAQGDVSPDTHAAFYAEFDFQGGAQTANSRESNSYNPRIRHVYGTIDWDNLGLEILAGQNWSLATLNSKGITPRNEVIPAVIDGQYLPGFTWARQPQLRIVKNWNKQIWIGVSIESPQTTFAGTPTGVTQTAPGVTAVTTAVPTNGFDVANTLSLNHYPDVIGKIVYEPVIGGSQPLHLEVYGLFRSYYDRVAYAAGNALGIPAGSQNLNTTGGGVGGGFTYAVIPNLLDLQGTFLTGRGVGRYGSGQLPDTVVKPDGSLSPITETMFTVGGTLHATSALDVYVYGGQERQGRRLFTVPGSAAAFGFGNPAAILTGCSIEGGTCNPNLRQIDQVAVGFWDKVYSGHFGQVRVGVEYSHTNLTAFDGVGGTPKTSDDMVFTSFRYYPF